MKLLYLVRKDMKKMRKKAKVCVGLFLCLSLITGCGNSSELKLSDVKKDTLYISEDNSIELINVEEFEKDYYNESDLKTFIEDAIDTYSKNNDGKVKLEDFSVEDKIAKSLLTFDSPETYEGFQKVDFQIVETDAIEGNLVLPEKFQSVKGDSTVDKDTVLAEDDLQLLIVNEPLNIKLDGTIKYYAGASITGDNEAEVTGEDSAIIAYK